MEVLRRLKLIKGKESEARRQILNELFQYKKGLVYGPPPQPTAAAYDCKLSFLAIGSQTGAIRIYGKPGVQFVAQHPEGSAVECMHFLNEEARLITLHADRSIYKWEMNVSEDGNSSLTSIASFIPSDSSKVAKWVTCLTTGKVLLFVADSSTGNVAALDVDSFALKEDSTILQEHVLKIASDEQKSKGVTVSIIVQHPTEQHLLMFGYAEGVMIMWNSEDKRSEKCFGTNQPLQYASFNRSGSDIITSHLDGSYMNWNLDDILKHIDNPTTPYGPFACKEITKIVQKTSSKDSSPYIFFTGGLSKSTFDDKHSLTLMHGSKHVVYDLRSKVVDFIVMCEADEKDGTQDADNPHTLLIITEDELLFVDLTSDDWSLYGTCGVVHIHSSPVSAILHKDQISQNVWIKIDFIRRKYIASVKHLSQKEWPIKGGQITAADKDHDAELLVTGHEDGSVVFWRLSNSSLKKLFVWSSGDIYDGVGLVDATSSHTATDENWPPFRKLTNWTQKYEDSRLHITTLSFCPETGVLVVGGISGQVIVCNLENQDNKLLPSEATFVDILGKGEPADCLTLKKSADGLLSVEAVLQIDCSHPCSDLALRSDWKLLAIGTMNGFVLYDLQKKKVIMSKLTANRPGVVRSRSFQQSLRDSFRGLKRKSISKSSDEAPDTPVKTATEKVENGVEKAVEGVADVVEKVETAVTDTVEEVNTKIEQVAEDAEKKVEEGLEKLGINGNAGEEENKLESEGQVKIISQEVKEHKIDQMTPSKKSEVITTVTTTNITVSSTTTTKKDGTVVEEETKKSENGLSPNINGVAEGHSRGSTLKREGVTFDMSLTPSKVNTGSGGSVTCVRFADTFLAHSVTATMWVGLYDGKVFAYQLVIPAAGQREEEDVSTVLAKEIHLKHGAPICGLFVIDDKGKVVTGPIFSLPGLRAQYKHKLFKNKEDGAIVCVHAQNFKSVKDDAYSEEALLCITSKGDVHAIHLPSLRPQVKVPAIGNTDLIGQSCFQSNGIGMYRSTPWQLTTFSIAAACRACPPVQLNLKDGMRPVVVETKQEVVMEIEDTGSPVHDAGKKLQEADAKKEEEVKNEDIKVEEVKKEETKGAENDKGDSSVPQPPQAGETTKTVTTETITSKLIDGAKPQDIIVDVKKYSTVTTTTTTLENETSDANELLEDRIKNHLE
ncbi:hypothetical protein HELRODRAFT_169422 [Helobdella robusta]|uniref:Lethal giant larvae homologue 2 domain-containing protein n=1 Tax=Helobdella robusta TaxID=6412 RepID=T1F1X0_HELRO|nr:hypothetical protein HELRODRAFT_169422 [Helobdella robusta]ESO08549.1 hypothetical protein HELRODRAFT_169422 [Helobdella robusta]